MEAELWKRLTGNAKCVCLNHHSGSDITFVYLAVWNWPANSHRAVWKSSKCIWMTGVGGHLKDAMRSGMSFHYLKLLWPPHMPSLVFPLLKHHGSKVDPEWVWYSFWDEKAYSLWNDITTLRCRKWSIMSFVLDWTFRVRYSWTSNSESCCKIWADPTTMTSDLLLLTVGWW